MDFLNKHSDIIPRYDRPSSTGKNLQREIRQECRKPGVVVALTRCKVSVLLTTSESGDGVPESKRTPPEDAPGSRGVSLLLCVPEHHSGPAPKPSALIVPFLS